MILPELQSANNLYEQKLAAGNSSDQAMFSISWDIEELKSISAQCRKIHHELTYCINACTHDLFEQRNIPRKMTEIRSTMCKVIKRISHFRRTPATHVFILMISCDLRDKKPYALPVQCLPYAGLKEMELRTIVSNLCKEMTSMQMKVSGIFTFLQKIRFYRFFRVCY